MTLVELFNSRIGQDYEFKSIRNAVKKLYACMMDLELKERYGVLTSVDSSWFFRLTENNELQVSNEIPMDKLLRSVFVLLHLVNAQFQSVDSIFEKEKKIPIDIFSNDLDKTNEVIFQDLAPPGQEPLSVRYADVTPLDGGRSGEVYKVNAPGYQKPLVYKICRDTSLFSEMLNEKNILIHLNRNGFKYAPVLIRSVENENKSIVNVTEFIEGRHIGFTDMPSDVKLKCQNLVNELHRLNVLHKDIHPSNFIVTDSNECYVLDFGFSILLDEPDEEFLKIKAREYSIFSDDKRR